MEVSNQQMYLLKYCQQGDNKALKRLINRGSVNLNHIYKYNKTEYNVFQVTCMALHAYLDDESYNRIETKYVECVRILLEQQIDIKYKDPDFRAEAIEYSLFSGSKQIVKLTVEAYERRGLSVKHMELLNLIFFFFGNGTRLHERHLSIIEVLLDMGVDINIFDYETGEPPIFTAARLKFKNVVQMFVTKKFSELDCDYYADLKGRTARYFIIKSNLYDGKLPTPFASFLSPIYHAIMNKDSEKFFKEFKEFHKEMTTDQKISVLYRAIHSGNVEIVEYMIQETRSCFKNYNTLLEIAIKRGFYKLVSLLFEDRKIDFDFSLLQHLTAMNNEKIATLEINQDTNYNLCLKCLLTHSSLNLNQLDRQDKTLLEIAINSKNYNMAQTLLNFGASLIKYNTAMEDGECLVINVCPKVLENHFTESMCCMYEKYLKRRRILNDRIMLSYILKYQSILPPRYDIEPRKRTAFPPDNVVIFSKYVPEIKVPYLMSEDRDYRYLLKHPFLLAFIALKWHRVKCIFYTDILVYFIFICVFNMFILVKVNMFTLLLLIMSFLMILCWNVVQIFLFQIKYFTVFENWMKLFMFGLTIAMILISEPLMVIKLKHKDFVHRQLDGVGVLLSITNLFFLMGHFPRVSIYVIMIKAIYKTIFTSFVQYSILLIGFTSSFYLLFQVTYPEFFSTFTVSFIKTVLMASRDYDSTYVGIAKYPFPHTSYIIFLAFVALISLGLLNLLTGLAINDVQKMRENAELYNEILRIKNIHRLENIFLKASIMRRMSLMRVLSLFSIFDKRTIVEIDPKKRVAYVLSENLLNIPVDSKLLNAIENSLRNKQLH